MTGDEAAIDRKAAVRLVLDAWRARGWTETAGAALALVHAHEQHADLSDAVPAGFLARNSCEASDVARVANSALRSVSIATELPTIINPEQIDSFSRVAEVSASEVAGITRPLALPEAEVKRMLLTIIGEPEVPRDWGGERSDAFSTNVILNGARIAASFVLKGPSKKGELSPASYGANGDQLQRSFTQPASLHVIQANASLAPSIRELANGLILDARAKGDDRAVATCWDGTDTARILAAHGFIDPADGRALK